MAEIMYRDALRQAIFEEMEKDPTVFIMGEGIAGRGGSYKVTEGLLKEFGSGRVVDTPLSEATFTGAAVGAALVGMRPIVEILFVDFTALVMDQLINQAAKYEFMSGGQGKVPMVLRTQGGAGNGLAGQHSQSLEALYYHIPGLKLVMPSTPYDAKGLLKAAIRDDDPVIFLEHKLLYMTTGEVPEEEYIVRLGQAEIKRAGEDITVVTYSYMTLKCLEAAEALAQEGISVEVVDLRTLTPLDKSTILDSVEKTGKAIVVNEAVKRGGVGGDIAAMIMEEAYDDLDAPVMRIAGKNTTIPYNLELEKACTPTVKEIVEGILELL
ncbi:MAG: alpha-ketoacid dehydrogenase subunit beta [Desulfobacteraceae bacterium]|jgi:pyruvate dehydrogenase E1 component beta subunit|nr:alpha-ketoacid dehydrogenase subunit beta [Desulfobacteraceae bacterium]